MYAFSIFEPLNYFERSSIKRAFSSHVIILVRNLQVRNQFFSYPPISAVLRIHMFIFMSKSHLKLFYWTTLKHFLFLQSSEAILRRKCSENMQQIYWRTPIIGEQPLQSNFIKITLWHGKFAPYFQNTFS